MKEFEPNITNQKDVQEMIRAAKADIREDNQEVIDSMPDVATTPGQEELKKKHGTPREFATAAFDAVGEISCLEAHASVADYKERWEHA